MRNYIIALMAFLVVAAMIFIGVQTVAWHPKPVFVPDAMGTAGSSAPPQTTRTDAPAVAQCAQGASRPCQAESCQGTQTCEGGVWSQCYVKRVCRPGEQLPCQLDGCAFAIQTCNACGSGWSACVPG